MPTTTSSPAGGLFRIVSVLRCAPLFGTLALAQVTPPASGPSTGTAKEDVVELSPFTVSSANDRGYQVQSPSAAAGSRRI